ncbi:MAG TPA: hypothetical protein VEO92_02250, partial [Candidatus Nitrosocosmicus sp.]|nr:hypothetical protein [Candidatus Nitrosocosmicus sp.]
ENDRVWKVSSEKVPHMTLLFLGDSNKVANLDSIMQFVGHAAERSLNRFYLPVDHRGELGADQADVLFFKKGRYDFKAVREFRSLLLKDPNIRTAYDGATQFETPESVGEQGQEWIPHLTLGYPATPAKSMPDDWSVIYDVQFNKIAVWTGDYEGPEFLLKDYWDEIDMDSPAIAMANMNKERKALGIDALIEHHGVKGMKWGVRKVEGGGEKAHIRIHQETGRAQLSKQSTAAILVPAVVMPVLTPVAFLSPRVRAEVKAAREVNKGVKADQKWQKQLTSAKKSVEVHNKAADEINQKLPAFNSDKRWKNADGSDIHLPSNPKKQQEYDRAAMDELLNPAYAKAAISVHGAQSPGGRYKFEIADASTGTMKVRDTLKEKQAAHAADDDEVSIQFKIKRDNNGHILGFAPKEEEGSMSQTEDLGVEFLEHYGVKGMRWGVRNDPGSGGRVGTTAKKVGGGAKTVAKGVGKAAKGTAKFVGDVNFENRVENGRARELVIAS